MLVLESQTFRLRKSLPYPRRLASCGYSPPSLYLQSEKENTLRQVGSPESSVISCL